MRTAAASLYARQRYHCPIRWRRVFDISRVICGSARYLRSGAKNIDSDGKAYLYYGGSAGANLGIQQLNTNTMTSFSAPLNVITPPGFTEAAFMSKRNGIYYISYSNGNWQNNTYNVRYATAPSPLGPWTYKGQILAPDSLHKGPGSHAFLQVPDTDIWYICYHYWDSVYSTRHVALDSIYYNPDGTIKPIAMTAATKAETCSGDRIVYKNIICTYMKSINANIMKLNQA